MKKVLIAVIPIKGEIYSTENRTNHIQADTFIFQESVRVVKFKNENDIKITIPFENIEQIREG